MIIIRLYIDSILDLANSMTIQTENKNGSGTIDQAITVVATPEPMETQQTARHMLQVTAPSALPEVRDTTI